MSFPLKAAAGGALVLALLIFAGSCWFDRDQRAIRREWTQLLERMEKTGTENRVLLLARAGQAVNVFTDPLHLEVQPFTGVITDRDSLRSRALAAVEYAQTLSFGWEIKDIAVDRRERTARMVFRGEARALHQGRVHLARGEGEVFWRRTDDGWRIERLILEAEEVPPGHDLNDPLL